jgi:hypothetical protein
VFALPPLEPLGWRKSMASTMNDWSDHSFHWHGRLFVIDFHFVTNFSHLRVA